MGVQVPSTPCEGTPSGVYGAHTTDELGQVVSENNRAARVSFGG